jgi:D-glycero-D-manno-heptose 1,7-bisphosphate phosphatase
LGYVYRPEDLRWIPGALESVSLLNKSGYRVVVVTNQSGVARGLYDEHAVIALHEHMQARLGERGAHIDAFYYCPHHPQGKVASFAIACGCRKPKAGLLEQAARDWPVDRARSFLIGDKDDDLTAAATFGIYGVKFNSEAESLLDVVRAAMVKVQ